MQLKLIADSGGELKFPRLLWGGGINRKDPYIINKAPQKNSYKHEGFSWGILLHNKNVWVIRNLVVVEM